MANINAIFIIFILFILGCKEPKKKSEEIVCRVTIDSAYCTDSAKQLFARRCVDYWPNEKPKSVYQAVSLLDSIADDNFRNIIVNCDMLDFYFGIGLTIRNNWVRNGDSMLGNQLFDDYKMLHIDNSSGIILGIYKIYLTDSNVNIVSKLKTNDIGIINKIRDCQNQLKSKRLNKHFLIIKK